MLIELTDLDFKHRLHSEPLPILVDFWAPWCGPCLRFAPQIKKLAKAYETSVVVATANVDQCRELAQTYQVKSIPHLILFTQGSIAAQHSGSMDYLALESWLTRQLAELTSCL